MDLQKYAQVLINFALNSGEGLKPGEIVYLQFDSAALPLAVAVSRQIHKSGGHVISKANFAAMSKAFFEEANDAQLDFFPEKYQQALVETIDHRVVLRADEDPMLLKDVTPAKIMRANKSVRLMRKWLNEKEDNGKLTWTLANYPTEAMAKEAGLSVEEYSDVITKACFLDLENPIAKWQEVYREMESVRTRLNALAIQRINIKSDKTDLWITLGENRKWIGGNGRNIPSFELFTSPDWRGTNGYIYFDLPLYRYGNIIKGISLEFKDGKVIKATAEQNEKLLLEMIAQENADKVGEISLTDKRFSRIDKFMADTLFDENFGGEFGNTHLALGTSYHDTYDGDPKLLSTLEWERLGFNESAEHCDIISTTNRQVYAELKDGKSVLIYKDGQFA